MATLDCQLLASGLHLKAHIIAQARRQQKMTLTKVNPHTVIMYCHMQLRGWTILDAIER
jgi:hypothetical protein